MPAGDPNDPNQMSRFMSEMRSCMSDMTKRVGAMESNLQGMQSTNKDAAQFAADFRTSHEQAKRAEAERRINAAVSLGKVSPYLKKQTIDRALEHSDHARDCFAAGHARNGLTPFQAFLADIDARMPDERMAVSTPSANVVPDVAQISAFAREALLADPAGTSALKKLESRTKAA